MSGQRTYLQSGGRGQRIFVLGWRQHQAGSTLSYTYSERAAGPSENRELQRDQQASEP